jgi:hypothetical protein
VFGKSHQIGEDFFYVNNGLGILFEKIALQPANDDERVVPRHLDELPAGGALEVDLVLSYRGALCVLKVFRAPATN